MTDPVLTKCPTANCRATPDDLWLVYNVESHDRIDSQSGGELYVREGHYESPPDKLDPRMRCSRCGATWPLAKGTTVLLVSDGTTKRMFTVS